MGIVSWSDDADEFLPRIWGSAGVRLRSHGKDGQGKGRGFGKAGKGKAGKGKAGKGIAGKGKAGKGKAGKGKAGG